MNFDAGHETEDDSVIKTRRSLRKMHWRWVKAVIRSETSDEGFGVDVTLTLRTRATDGTACITVKPIWVYLKYPFTFRYSLVRNRDT